MQMSQRKWSTVIKKSAIELSWKRSSSSKNIWRRQESPNFDGFHRQVHELHMYSVPDFLKLNQLWQFLLGSQIYSVERPTVRKADHLMAENRYSNSSQWCLARSRCGHNDSGSVASFWTSVAPFCLRSNHLTWLKTQVVGHRQFMAKSSWPYSSVWLMISLFVDWLRAIWYKPAWRQSRMAESIYYAYDAVVCVTCWVNDQNR